MAEMKNFLKHFEFSAKWYKHQEWALIEIALFQHFKGDALYIFFIQIFKFVVSLNFNIYDYTEYQRACEGIPT